MVYLVLTALCFNKCFQRKNMTQISFCLYHRCITAQHSIPCTLILHNHSQTFIKHSFWKNVDIHEKETTNNNIALNKVQTTGKSKLSYGEQKRQSFITCIVKWAIFFAGFCWLWFFLLENLKIKKKTLMMSTGTCGRI